MPKIVLIRTPIIQPSHHVGSLRAVPSIGLCYVQAALKKSGYEVHLIDGVGLGIKQFTKISGTNLIINGLTSDQILKEIPEDCDAIGVSVMHANEWVHDSIILQKISECFPNKALFIGGENATGSTDLILRQNPKISAVVLGEGDLIVPNLVKALLEKKDLAQVNGIGFVDGWGKIVHTPRVAPTTMVDTLAWPDWQGVPLENYFQIKSSISVHNDRSLPMMATRGCPHACSFCTVPNMWNSKWNPRDPADVVKEMKTYVDQFHIEHVDFVDLTFALNRQWTVKFCELLIEANLGVFWSLPIGTRVESLDREVLVLMKKAGCVRMLYSPESGSDITLLRIRKKLNISKMESVIRDSVQVGLIIKLATIFGFPGQSWKEVFGTFKFLIKAALIGVHDVVCLSFIPYPGTEFYDQLVAEAKINPHNQTVRLNNDLKNMVSWSEHIPSGAMTWICFCGMGLFYSVQMLVRPWRLYLLCKNIFVLQKPQTNIESILLSFWQRLKLASLLIRTN